MGSWNASTNFCAKLAMANFCSVSIFLLAFCFLFSSDGTKLKTPLGQLDFDLYFWLNHLEINYYRITFTYTYFWAAFKTVDFSDRKGQVLMRLRLKTVIQTGSWILAEMLVFHVAAGRVNKLSVGRLWRGCPDGFWRQNWRWTCNFGVFRVQTRIAPLSFSRCWLLFAYCSCKD